MNRTEAREILWETVRDNVRHNHYKRTTDLADKYYRFVTGDGLDKDMVQFVQREDDTMFQQRKNITRHIISTVVKNLMDCLLYTSPSPRDATLSRMPSSA